MRPYPVFSRKTIFRSGVGSVLIGQNPAGELSKIKDEPLLPLGEAHCVGRMKSEEIGPAAFMDDAAVLLRHPDLPVKQRQTSSASHEDNDLGTDNRQLLKKMDLCVQDVFP